FVWVIHPVRGRWILMSTDLSSTALQIAQIYGMRFRIELCFKQLIYQIGAFGYHLWMKSMERIKRCSPGQYLHKTSEDYRQRILRKIRAYEVFIQFGLIALGLIQYVALKYPLQVFKNFRGWYRTLNTARTPSEAVVANAMQNTFQEFLIDLPRTHTLKKFLANKVKRRSLLKRKAAA